VVLSVSHPSDRLVLANFSNCVLLCNVSVSMPMSCPGIHIHIASLLCLSTHTYTHDEKWVILRPVRYMTLDIELRPGCGQRRVCELPRLRRIVVYALVMIYEIALNAL
jgi:hypothetical protein